MAAPAAPIRVLRSGAGRPAYNLALDAALLEGDGPDTLRLYEWSPHGLSIGRFQDAGAFAELPGDHDLVRRQTGGGAILHGEELTFALVLDAAHALPTEAAYMLVHDAVARALAPLGVRAERVVDGAPPLGPRALRKAWCFASPARLDLVAPDGAKLCGSAQRRIRRPRARVLHHGSIPLERPAATPFSAALADQVDPATARRQLPDLLVAEFGRALGRPMTGGRLGADEHARALALEPGFRVARTVTV